MARLLLVRHGDVESDTPGRYWGHSDIPLSAEGIRQAGKIRERLATEKIVAIYSSDLRRALNTATIIAIPHQVPVVPCPELREINFGHFEGMTFEEIKRWRPEAEGLWWGTDPNVGFPDGESLWALAQRIDCFVERLSNHDLTDTVLVVAHGGSLRMLVCRMIGLDLSHWWQLRIDHASLSVLDSYPGGAVISLLNEVCHLKAS